MTAWRVSWLMLALWLAPDAALAHAYLEKAVPAQRAMLFAPPERVRHGVGGFGDGPAGKALKPKPADLTAKHTGDHTAGDLFWWLSHGKNGTAMPGFQEQLSEEARWDLINFLRTLSVAKQARQMAPLLEPAWLVAPDFVYRTAAGDSKSLKEHRGQSVVLLVLFSWPQSQARLTQLAGLRERLAAAGITLIAVPSGAAALDTKANRALSALTFDPVMDGGQEAFATYTLFRRSLSATGTQPDPPIPEHMEFLIDRQGYVRARWTITCIELSAP